MNIELGKAVGFEEVTQRLIDFADLLKRLEVDTYEFVALKVLILMSPGKHNICFQNSRDMKNGFSDK